MPITSEAIATVIAALITAGPLYLALRRRRDGPLDPQG